MFQKKASKVSGRHLLSQRQRLKLEKNIKFTLSATTLTAQDIAVLKSKPATIKAKDAVLLKLKNRIRDRVENLTEITELNTELIS